MVAKAPANFTVETFAAGDGELAVKAVQVETGKELDCEIVFNNDRKHTYSCSYFPEEEGDYVVTITWSGREIPKSPYAVNVEGFAGDATKVTGKQKAANILTCANETEQKPFYVIKWYCTVESSRQTLKFLPSSST